ncbi:MULTISPECIES: GtrA family protein [unclassified Streptomyces]|uniref:GtrA family protein n=1 Tax=unclassified Streptomyces TaxID=2593676 RepID=UPI002DDA8C86|nr:MULTISPECIES: GtrA family protein [unclassified Streptomyces]
MGEWRSVRPRLERIVRELAKFGAVGALGFLVNVAIFNLCIHTFQLAPIRSGVISQVVAIGTNYVGNRYWTYRHIDKSRVHRETSLFFLFSGIALVLENGILALSHYGFGYTSTLADNIAKNVIGLGIGTVFRFWSYRTWVFRVAAFHAEEDAAAQQEARPGQRTKRVTGSGARASGRGRRVDVGGLAAEEQREDRRQLLK